MPLLANAVFNLAPSLNPVPRLDPTTFAFAVSGLLFAVALFRLQMFDLVPVARSTLFDEMQDALLVLDSADRVVDCNPTATRLFGADCVGTPLAETSLGVVADGDVATVGGDGDRRTLDVRSTSLRDFRGDAVGRFVVLRDVTELRVLREQEQRLDVLNRVLRHNVRNEMNVVSGNAALLAADLDGEARDRAETIRAVADRTVERGEKARYVQSTLRGRGDGLREVDLSAAATAAAATAPVDVPVSGAERAPVLAVGRDHVRTAVAELVENAVDHTPPGTPVAVSVVPDGEWVELRVVDEGPGVPAVERAVLTEGRETALEHGSGIGLWLVHWVVTASDGRLDFEDTDPDGSTVVLGFRRADAPDG